MKVQSVVRKIVQLKLTSTDGKKYNTDCADVETIFRIIQSVPSKKAEPIKQWLAKVGYERIKEMADPTTAIDRARETYKSLVVQKMDSTKNDGSRDS